MSVYNRQYKLFEGPFTPVMTRFLVIPRYAFKRVFSSKLFIGFFVLCFIPMLVFGSMIYLYNSAGLLKMLNFNINDLMTIDTPFFMLVMNIQMMLCFLLTLFLGPPLISPDLANNALPLYLSRPFEKRDYVLGKFAVIYILNAAISWACSLLLFSLQAYLHDGSWLFGHLRIAFGLFVGSNLYIITIILFALALSAWLKWRTIAGFAFIALPIMAMGTGEALNGILHVKWGQYLNMDAIMETIYDFLFGIESTSSLSVVGCMCLLSMVWICSLLVLRLRIKAYEVVR